MRTSIICSFNIIGNFRPREEFELTPETEKELCHETSLSHRVKAIKDLSETVLNHRLEDVSIYKYIQMYLVIFIGSFLYSEYLKYR